MKRAVGLRSLWLAAASAACVGCAARFAENDAAGLGPASIRAASNALREAEPASESPGAPGAAAEPSTLPPSPPPAMPAAPNRTLRTLGWIGISVGAEAALVAIGTSAMILHQKTVRDDNCNAQRMCSSAGLDANGTIATLVGWNAAAWVVTAAGLGAGGILLAVGWEDAKRTTAIGAAPIGSGMGLRVRSSF